MSTVTRPWRRLVALSADESQCRLGGFLLWSQLQDHSTNPTLMCVCSAQAPSYCRTNHSHVWLWAAPCCHHPTSVGPCCCCCCCYLLTLLLPSGRAHLEKQRHHDAPRPEGPQQHLSKGSLARRPQVAREKGLAEWYKTWGYYVFQSCSVIVESMQDCIIFPFFYSFKRKNMSDTPWGCGPQCPTSVQLDCRPQQ